MSRRRVRKPELKRQQTQAGDILYVPMFNIISYTSEREKHLSVEAEFIV